MTKYKVKEYLTFGGKRYKLASQDVTKLKAKKLANELRSDNWEYARIVPEKIQKGYPWMKGRYRVYTRRRKAPK